MTLPDDLKEFRVLEELNLSSNLYTSSSSIVNPLLLFKSIGQMPKLKRLNLSRNRFAAFHSEMLSNYSDFPSLQELDFGYNIVIDQEDLWYTA